jgi:carbamoyl-phosphate synthase large subunit
MKITVFITAAGTASAINVIKALKKQTECQIRIVTADMNPFAAGLYLGDAHYRVPKATDPDFIESVLSICDRERADIVLPIFSKELIVFSTHRDRFREKGIAMSVSDPDVLRMCNDKTATIRFFEENRVRAPKTYPKEILELDDRLVPMPLFIKPVSGSGSAHSHKINDRDELRFYLNHCQDSIVQEFIEGQEYTVDVLADMESRVLVAVPRMRIETKAGQCTRGKTVIHAQMVQEVARIVKKAGIKGQCNIQCIEDQNGNVHFIEINPRFAAGGLMLSVTAGANIPFLLVKILLNLKIRPEELQYKPGVVMLRYWEELFFREDQLLGAEA